MAHCRERMSGKDPKEKRPVPLSQARATDSYIGRLSGDIAGLTKAMAAAAPEVSQGRFRERAYQARAVMSRDEIRVALTDGLRDAKGNFDALKTAWWPALRQALEQAGGDGLDVWLYGLFSPPGRAPRQPLFTALSEALIRLAASATFEPDAQAIITLVDAELAAPKPTPLSFKQLEKELEGKLEVDEALSIRSATTDELSRRLKEIGASLEKLRDEMRSGPGKQGGGLYSNFARLKYEVKLLDLELKRREGTLTARARF